MYSCGAWSAPGAAECVYSGGWSITGAVLLMLAAFNMCWLLRNGRLDAHLVQEGSGPCQIPN